MKSRYLERLWRRHEAFQRDVSHKLALTEALLVLSICLVSLLSYGHYL